MTQARIAVVGRGLMGAAAARHLATAGLAPALIGPDEPAEKATHRGVFASHYDEGRVARKNATDAFWAAASMASIGRYRLLERASGIPFFTETGALMAGPGDGDFLARARKVNTALEIGGQELDRAGLAERLPELELPDGWQALWEPDRAGHISPRRLVAAQTRLAVAQGAYLISDVVDGIGETANGVTVRVGSETLGFDHVLVAAGGMTDHVLGRPRELTVYGRTVALFEIAPEATERFAALPSVVMGTPESHYLLPAIRYPDGKAYMKLGGDPDDLTLTGPDEIGDWFRSGGREVARAALISKFQELVPAAPVVSVQTDACMTTWSRDGHPEIRALSPRLSVLTAGNGAGAKCSDELGLRAARPLIEIYKERKAS